MSTNYHWDTQALPPGQGAKLWTQAISLSFQHVQTQCHGQNFHGTLRSQRLGEVAINRLTAQPYRVSTSRPQTDQPWLFLNVHQQGHCRLIQNGREQWLPAGSLSLNIGTSPFTLDFVDEVIMTTLRLPLDGLLPYTGPLNDVVAQPLAQGASLHLLEHYLQGLLLSADDLRANQHDQAWRCLRDLLAMSINERRSASPAPSAARYEDALRYLSDRLGDPALNIAALSKHLGMAPRTVQELFKAQGSTFTAQLMQLRLDAAAQLLRQTPSNTVAQIAYSVGFSDLSYFHRQFRRRFGITPGHFHAHGLKS